MASPAAIPARYAKFITALAGVAIAYLTAYGTTWNLQGFLVAAAAALAVFGVPNATAPVGLIVPGQSGKAASLPPTGTVTVVPGSGGYTPAAGPLEPPAPPAGPAGASS